MKNKALALTCGDPAGVGPEVIARWILQHPAEAADCVAIGPASWLEQLPIQGVAVDGGNYQAVAGKPDSEGARIALRALEMAADGCLSGDFGAVVTAPVSKKQLVDIGYTFPGQTEFFAERWGGQATMGFVGDRMRVVLASWHNPLADIPRLLRSNPEWIVQAVTQAGLLTRKLGVEEPRIAVCGLNPHAGEAGLLGSDEMDWIDPLLDKLRKTWPGLSHCLPSDTVFYRHLRGDFDVVVALYHDQGLGPLKTVEFDTAVNVSLGLKHIRTSPDHGTAFDIAGKGVASISSWAAAVRLARSLSS